MPLNKGMAALQSDALPAVSRKLIGRPFSSVYYVKLKTRKKLWPCSQHFRPDWEEKGRSFCPVFNRTDYTIFIMRAHDGRQSVENIFLQPFLSPTMKAIIHRRRRAIVFRTILPATTRLQPMNDAADNAPVIFAACPALVLREMFFQHRPLQVVQPKQILANRLRCCFFSCMACFALVFS
jgi:hypothetical protein